MPSFASCLRQACLLLSSAVLAATESLLAESIAAASSTTTNEPIRYGVDVSFPVHRAVSRNYPDLPQNHDPKHRKYGKYPIQPLGDRHAAYRRHVDGCRDYYRPIKKNFNCDRFEYGRVLMNNRQPQSMLNYTDTGFIKIRAPSKLRNLVDSFWQENEHRKSDSIEHWDAGNTYVNHWESPTHLLSVDDIGLHGTRGSATGSGNDSGSSSSSSSGITTGAELKQHIWAATSATLEEWTKQELQPSSLYGVRVYNEGAIMMPHVDRLPLVVSAILCVAQDVDEPWPTEIYDHDGLAHNVTLEPGDMLLFESHSIIHGHPFPLKGRFFASIFIHFELTGEPLDESDQGVFHLRKNNNNKNVKDNAKAQRHKEASDQANQRYTEDSSNGYGGASSAIGRAELPPYIKLASPEEENWRKEHPEGWTPPEPILPPEAHIAAQSGHLEALSRELDDPTIMTFVLTERDENGWQVLHQGVIGGNEDIVKLLIDHGADINARTHGGYGETPLRIAERTWGATHSIVRYLQHMGGLSIGPEL